MEEIYVSDLAAPQVANLGSTHCWTSCGHDGPCSFCGADGVIGSLVCFVEGSFDAFHFTESQLHTLVGRDTRRLCRGSGAV